MNRFALWSFLVVFVVGCNSAAPPAAPPSTAPVTTTPATPDPEPAAPAVAEPVAVAETPTPSPAPEPTPSPTPQPATAAEKQPAAVVPAHVSNAGPVPVAAIRAAFEKAKAGRGPADKINSLKQIGLAFHNFHDVFQHFPALDGIGNAQAKRGLSWRVQLLPFLEEAALYNEFNFDEPWDSPHNKALLPRMPKVYGDDPEGKTRMHVFTGNGAPFEKERGRGIRDYTDGTSNTLMVVEAGESTADFWTKPEGLPFDPDKPLAALGNVDEKFPALLTDGSVRMLPRDLPAAEFAKLVMLADGQPLDGAILQQQMRRPVAAQPTEVALPPLAPPGPNLDLSYIPAEACVAVIVQPRRVHEHKLVQAISKEMPPLQTGQLRAFDLPIGGVTEVPRAISEQLGIPWQAIESLTLLIDRRMFAGPAMEVQLPQALGCVMRTSVPLNVETVMASIVRTAPVHPELREENGTVSVVVNAPLDLEWRFLSDRELLMGAQPLVQAMAAATDIETPLTQRLRALGNPALAVGIDAEPFAELLKQNTGTLPPAAALFLPYLTNARAAALTFDLDSPQLLSASIVFQKEQFATGLKGMLEPQIDFTRQRFAESKANLADSEVAPLVPLAESLLDGVKFEAQGDTATLIVARPEKFDDLPTLIKPMMQKARAAGVDADRQNALRQIGLAMHNFHDTYRHFPALDSRGDEKAKRGLSWRVHLLPFLDHAPLYNEFHQDEPWDSPHNKTLIAKMPEVFGKNPDGKTRLHVFTGEGAPFQEQKGPGIRDIKDGTSNTILVVEAGEDTAEIWTKPTGLVCDPEKPLDCLGNIGEVFQILLMDGSVRKVSKTIDPQTFRLLVLPADGQAIGAF